MNFKLPAEQIVAKILPNTHQQCVALLKIKMFLLSLKVLVIKAGHTLSYLSLNSSSEQTVNYEYNSRGQVRWVHISLQTFARSRHRIERIHSQKGRERQLVSCYPAIHERLWRSNLKYPTGDYYLPTYTYLGYLKLTNFGLGNLYNIQIPNIQSSRN